MALGVVVTCALGLEELLARELQAVGVARPAVERGAVTFSGSWEDCWRANWRLRTANRVLVELGSWAARSGKALAYGARDLVGRDDSSYDGIAARELFHPSRSLSVRATVSASVVRDVRWAALTVKDGIVDGQRLVHGRRSSVDRGAAQLPLRLRLHRDRATLLLDSSGVPLDRRGYRANSGIAPVREQLAAACVLAADEWSGPVFDPMCGSGTLLVEAGWIAVGRAPGCLRRSWVFQGLPGFDHDRFRAVRAEPVPAVAPDVQLRGSDLSSASVALARDSLGRAGLADRSRVSTADAFVVEPPPGPGLVVVNPPHGERMEAERADWKRLGDLLKRRFAGWRAVVLAGGASRGKWIGLRPSRRLPVTTGPLAARILVFDLF
jgi:putative N6-adenine-specific DNA methylase